MRVRPGAVLVEPSLRPVLAADLPVAGLAEPSPRPALEADRLVVRVRLVAVLVGRHPRLVLAADQRAGRPGPLAPYPGLAVRQPEQLDPRLALVVPPGARRPGQGRALAGRP